MSTEENKQINNRIVDSINKGDFSQLNQLFAPNFIEHTPPPGVTPNREGTLQFIQVLRRAFPDLHYTVEKTVAEGDRVAQYITGTGTMKGDIMGMAASGKKATWSESHIIRLVDGKVVEHWEVVDQAGMMRQLGFLPGIRR